MQTPFEEFFKKPYEQERQKQGHYRILKSMTPEAIANIKNSPTPS